MAPPHYVSGILGRLIGADMNSTADQEITINAAKYIVRKIIAANPSTSLTLAAGGIYTAASKGGTAIVAAVTVYSGLTAAAKYVDLTLAALLGTDALTLASLYLSLTTGQGAPATADIYVIGDALPT